MRAAPVLALADCHDGTAETLLRDIVDELRQIRVALERQRRPSHLTREDRDRLGKILPVVVGLRGSELFLAGEFIDDDAPALRLVCHGLTARQLGRLLATGRVRRTSAA